MKHLVWKITCKKQKITFFLRLLKLRNKTIIIKRKLRSCQIWIHIVSIQDNIYGIIYLNCFVCFDLYMLLKLLITCINFLLKSLNF
jgi:hypothetical protein